MAEFDIRQMPYSLEAEQAVLGAAICDESLMSEISFLTSEDFYLEQHKLIYKEMLSMFAASKPIDAVTLINALVTGGRFTDGDAAKYIKMLADAAPVTANIGQYADIVRGKAVLRSVIGVARELSDRAFGEACESEGLVQYAEKRIFEISHDNRIHDFKDIANVVIEEYARLEEISKNPAAFSGTKIGFSSIDRYIVGLNPGDFVVVGARPGIGKTSFCLNVAANVAKATKREVAIFSLEMPAYQLVSRMLASESGVDNHNMRTGALSDDDWVRLAEASSSLSETKIIIDDTSSITLPQMKAKLRRRKDLALVIIDYLQLMTAVREDNSHYENRVNEISAMTRGLKLMAMELGVPVILCSQLNRGLADRKDKKPELTDLRESGSIEQDADIVMLLYKYAEKSDKKDGEAVKRAAPTDNGAMLVACEVAKNRHGGTGVINMNWHGSTYRFTAISDFDEQ